MLGRKHIRYSWFLNVVPYYFRAILMTRWRSLTGRWTQHPRIRQVDVCHYSDVIIGAMATQITSLTIVYPTVYSDTDQRKHQSSAWLDFAWEIHRWPVISPHKGPVTRKMLPFGDVTWDKYFLIGRTNKCDTEILPRYFDNQHQGVSPAKEHNFHEMNRLMFLINIRN